MSELLHELILRTAIAAPHAQALRHKDKSISYEQLASGIERIARGLARIGLARQERVAVYLPKTPEAVVAFFATNAAGGVFVPVNPLLKPEQVAHILADCNVRVLVTSRSRLQTLSPALRQCRDLHSVVLVDAGADDPGQGGALQVVAWEELEHAGDGSRPHRVIDVDMASILYTSGSTGRPKGVVLSHRNMVTGAISVSTYLENRPEDRLLAVLPFSFDYGFSQLSTAFRVGATVVLMDYLLPRDVIAAVGREGITGLAAVPPLWVQLAGLEWPQEAAAGLRYVTNSGGAMPRATLNALRAALPRTQVFLMYGLTEAFRSTYLPPEEVDRRPDSMGKAIPNAEIMVLREDGSPCGPGEPGELVHRGSLVAMGYWNDPERTAARFKPVPRQADGLVIPEVAVWSGDTVRTDEQGFLYFVGRKDDMIKTSGYRVSPTEVEEVVYQSGLVAEAAAIGAPHPVLGQAIVVAAVAPASGERDAEAILAACRQRLPAFMVPTLVTWYESLPRNPNGKIDRKHLAQDMTGLFEEED